jgi:hypothetical protein
VLDDEANENATDQTAARAAKRRRRATAGTLDELRRELWHATRTIGATLDDPNLTPSEACRVANSLAALANAYRGVTEAADLEGRIAALEAAHPATMR